MVDLRDEEGNALLLMPAAVLILMILGAIAADFALVFLGERNMADLSASIANDAAAALEVESLMTSGDVAIDLARAQDIASRHVAVFGTDGGTTVDACSVTVPSPSTVLVTCRGTVDPIFSDVVGGASTFAVEATSRGEVVLG